MATPVVGRYSLYKAGTRKLVQWLVSTSELATKSGLTTRDLLACTEAVISADADIPWSIIELTQDVILGRQVCADWYADQGDADAEKNDSHIHFIDVLRTINTRLMQCRQAKNARALTERREVSGGSQKPGFDDVSPGPGGSPDKKSLANLFRHLHVEELPEDTSPDVPLKAKSPKPKSREGAKPELDLKLELDNKAEKEFAVWCFLQDMDELRQSIVKTWSEYRYSNMSLKAASIITDAAFGLMRRAEAQLEANYPEFHQSANIYKFLGLKLGVKKNPGFRSSGSDTPAELPKKSLSLLCPMGMAAISQLHVVLNLTAATKGGTSSSDRLQQEIDGYIENVSYHPFAKRFFKSVHLLVALCQSIMLEPTTHSALNELIIGIAHMQEHKRVRFWLGIAMQTYLDIDDIIGETNVQAADYMSSILTESKTILNGMAEYRRKDPYRNVRDALELSKIRKTVAFEHDMNDPQHLEEIMCGPRNVRLDSLLRLGFDILPDLAGLRAHWHRLAIYGFGMASANDVYAIIFVAYLYKACRHFGVLDCEWPDMEWFLARQNKTQTLVPEAGSNASPEFWWRKLVMALGIPPAEVAGKRHSRHPVTGFEISKRARRIQTCSALLVAMDARAATDRIVGMSPRDSIEIVLQELADKAEQAHNAADTENGAKRSKIGKQRNQATSTRTPLQLLKVFKTHVLDDESEFDFDHITFWTKCSDLLATVRKSVGPLMREKPGQPRLDGWVVCLILRQAATQIADYQPVTMTYLPQAARALKDLIEAEGSRFTSAE